LGARTGADERVRHCMSMTPAVSHQSHPEVTPEMVIAVAEAIWDADHIGLPRRWEDAAEDVQDAYLRMARAAIAETDRWRAMIATARAKDAE
jgi:hypothetical protein